jgi:hypothetical protein
MTGMGDGPAEDRERLQPLGDDFGVGSDKPGGQAGVSVHATGRKRSQSVRMIVEGASHPLVQRFSQRLRAAAGARAALSSVTELTAMPPIGGHP